MYSTRVTIRGDIDLVRCEGRDRARHKRAIVLGNALIAYRTMHRCIANLSANLDVNIMISRIHRLRSRKPVEQNVLLPA